MILSTDLSDEQRVMLRSAGFNPVREDIDALGLGYVRLQTPDDKGLAQSIRQARKIAPNAAIGSNPIYFQSGPTTRGSGALADGGRNAGRAVGLIDGGVGKHPAPTGHIERKSGVEGKGGAVRVDL